MSTTTLSRRGAEQLARAEEAIERGLATFMEVGQALSLIRDGRLYRENHESFEAYCRGRWGFSSRRANQLMDAAEIGTMVPIQNERQARELAALKADPEAVKAAYKSAAETGEVTTASLAGAVQQQVPNVDENGEILSTAVDTATSGSDHPESPGSGAAGPGDDEQDETPAPSPAPKVAPPVDPVLGYRARATTVRSQVRDSLLTLDAERVVETSDDPQAWADLSSALHGWLDNLDAALAGPKLKAVR